MDAYQIDHGLEEHEGTLSVHMCFE